VLCWGRGRAGEGAPRHSRAAAAGSSRSGEGAAWPGLHACRVCWVGARQGTGVVGRLWRGTPEHVPRRQPREDGGRARRRMRRACARMSATTLNRGATSCFGAMGLTAPWYGSLGAARTGRQRADRWSSAASDWRMTRRKAQGV
jgi:hypothetical protein